jgi:two-component system, sensor histidine kinase and response regulator
MSAMPEGTPGTTPAYEDRASILIVDDEPMNLLALEAILEPLGQEIVKAASGEEALRAVLSADYAVILMDARMPGMDGFEAATLIRNRDRSRNVPIIFLTANTTAQQAFRGYAVGAVDYLFKPFDPDILRTKTQVFVDLFRQQEQIRRQAELLERARLDLERRVEERTTELRKANERLRAEIRDREAVERELAARARELARSNSDLEQFAYAASHDLQAPLRIVASYVQLLARKYSGRLEGEAHTYIDHAVSGVTRMQELIRDLLEYSRAGRMSEGETADLAVAVREATENLRIVLDEAEAQVDVSSLPVVAAGGVPMRQLFQNLIGNAVKFRGERPLRIEVAAERLEESWLVRVRDNGIGVDGRHKDRIFAIFQRLHPPDRYPGTGIGLAICKKIVESHGGRIWVESEPGDGATFYFTVPSVEASSPAAPALPVAVS